MRSFTNGQLHRKFKPGSTNPLLQFKMLFFLQRIQRILTTIWTLSCWYSLDSSRCILSDEYPCARLSTHFSGYLYHFVLAKIQNVSNTETTFHPKHEDAKIIHNHLKPVMLVSIRWLLLSTFRWVPMCQGFSHISAFLHLFVSLQIYVHVDYPYHMPPAA